MNKNQKPEYCDASVPRPKEAQASACGKAIIVGEHAVVYGAHAVALPLKNMRLNLSITPLPRHEKPLIQLSFAGHDASPQIIKVVADAIELLGYEPFSLSGRSSHTLPIGAGLGSSASLCVAVLRTLALSLGHELPIAQLGAYANELEKRFHGNPSGLDAAVVAYEACVLFCKNKPIRPIQLKNPEGFDAWNFILIDSGVRASTLAMVRLAEPYFKGRSGERHLQNFDQLSWLVYGALQLGDSNTVGAAMNECSDLLQSAGVVPKNLEQIIQITRRLGLTGVKTTGAGGGGMILGLLDPQCANQQQAAVERAFPQFPVLRFTIEA